MEQMKDSFSCYAMSILQEKKLCHNINITAWKESHVQEPGIGGFCCGDSGLCSSRGYRQGKFLRKLFWGIKQKYCKG